ncbi:hypothetical protein L2E82_25366 [Cichorium intybus]|uniref:Uncharacterized protein n=1 Tax=Cichorium intybus TaxID=13427 RepID=A0ACB9E3G7_CICIN|nr:hypothetical protein L2E82_25366 [Cichorium intybus]
MEITTMAQATQLHAQLLKHQQTDPQNLTKIFNFTALSPSGNLPYARHILNSLQTPTNSYFHNTMIRAYSDSSDPFQSISLFLTWHNSEDPFSPTPDRFTYPFVLKACSKLKQKRFGKQLHGLIYKSGFAQDLYIQNALIHFYSGCDQMGFASKVFDKMLERDVVSWTSVINGYVDNKMTLEGLRLFDKMVMEGFEPNDVTILSVLRACADSGALSVGMKLNDFVNLKVPHFARFLDLANVPDRKKEHSSSIHSYSNNKTTHQIHDLFISWHGAKAYDPCLTYED